MIRWASFNHNLALLLLLLVNIVEALPEHHHHEEEHACAQVDGNFFYVDALEEHGDLREPVLRSMRLGDDHEHDQCPLCQLLSSGLLNEYPVQALWGSANAHGSGSSVWDIGSPVGVLRSRGPPGQTLTLLG